MKIVLFLALLGLLLAPLRAEDWTTSDGKVYRNVQVLSHDAGYVTILYEDGGGRIPLSALGADVQKRFNYDPVKAAAAVAATKAQDQRDKEALAKEIAQTQAQQEQAQRQISLALAEALFPPPSNAAVDADANTPNNPPSADQAVAAGELPPSPEPASATEIEDYYDYGDNGWYGGWYGYGGYGYGYGYPNRAYRYYYGGANGGVHRGTGSSSGSAYPGTTPGPLGGFHSGFTHH